ncbi:epidermal retinol dehydrogenase 2-like [Gigantopelta aegis]|uniref:epidermal retinol dehydrogenase 2-like n=1 Tax=Gigantopelta aegis TaxID=1735272 RepID=UPI001B88A2E5|nr:epidermal retinol dehydrogenase 2-like [Gigantopelta aegis]
MHIVFEFLVLLVRLVYVCLEAVVLAFLPASVRGKDVAGETVLITGAGSGIGRLLAKKFAQLGCRMVLWDINKESNEETGAMLKKYGSTVRTYRVDLSNLEEIYHTADMVKEELGQVDILVNNAGIVTGKKFMQCPDSLVQKTMEVNCMAHFWTVKAFMPAMMEHNHGHIVNIASSAGLIGITGLADYCASKFAAVGFDESLRFELLDLGKDGVHTTVVCPYLISTGMFEGCKSFFPWLLPPSDPEDVADRIIDAILCNAHIVFIPRVLHVLLVIKGLLPTKGIRLVCQFLKVNRHMDSFIGRQTTEPQK